MHEAEYESGPEDSVEYESDSQDSCSEEWQLLDDSTGNANVLSDHDLLTAPLMTREAFLGLNDRHQYGLMGRVLGIHSKERPTQPNDSRLYLNTNSPFSAIVCGVQGSGKSHTVATMLENMLISNCAAIGSLEKALSGLVLHYSEGGPNSTPCEAAFLSSTISSEIKSPLVQVFVPKSSLQTMSKVYSRLGACVKVKPLLFHPSELDAPAILSMMAVDSEFKPLYMQTVLSILRELGERYTYVSFLDKLEDAKEKFNRAQVAGLEQRLSLLTSFLETNPKRLVPRFGQGLTIVDLSDPFLDPSTACGLFEIVVRLFVRANTGTGKVLVVDEAHKYLSSARSTTGLTHTLLTLIRQQRHLAMRVIISTQEPTVVPPILIDLCSVVVLHRFSSPNWWKHIIHHVPTDFSDSDAFDNVVKLQTGEAIILAPSGIGLFATEGNETAISNFGRRYLIVKTRKRVTTDGGASVLVVN